MMDREISAPPSNPSIYVTNAITIDGDGLLPPFNTGEAATYVPIIIEKIRSRIGVKSLFDRLRGCSIRIFIWMYFVFIKNK